MKRGRTKYDDSETPVFVTSSITSHINVFKLDSLANKALTQLEDVREKYGMRIFAYCLMPNHIHLILQSNATGDLSNFMREWKSVTAREILTYAEDKSPRLLQQFEKAAEKYHLSNKQRHHVWASRFDDLQLRTSNTIRVKLNYIHENPVRKGIVQKTGDYEYSSAGWYEEIGDSRVKLSDIRDLLV